MYKMSISTYTRFIFYLKHTLLGPYKHIYLMNTISDIQNSICKLGLVACL